MKKLIGLITVLVSVIAFASITYAAGWKQEGTIWKYEKGDGTLAASAWELVDGNYYYFDANGNMLADTVTPDGYYVDASGKWIPQTSQAGAPDSFKEGYQYGEFSRFNSYASVNGLGNTPIWIEGTYSSIFPVSVNAKGTPATIYCAHFTDTNGNKWLVQLEWDVLATPDSFYSLIGHNICIDGIYEGYSGTFNEPALHAKKVYDINSGAVIVSNYGSYI